MHICRMKIGIALLLCIFSMCFCVYAEQIVTTNVTVDENNIVKPSDKTMLSMGDTWDTWRMYMGDSLSTETSKQYLDMMRMYHVPMNQQRMSGADANEFFWKDSLGPIEERGDGNPYSRNLGLVEWIKSVTSVNKNASFTFALNLIFDTPENHADLVRFLTLMPDDENAVGTDGINWAQKRIDLGIENPVKIKLFELGNEMYNEGYVPISSSHTVTEEEANKGSEDYVNDCIEAITAMKAVNPDISFAMCGYSSANGGTAAACAWNRKILAELSDDCEYIVDHKYYYDYNFKSIQEEIKARFITPMNEIPESKRPKLYYSEYGCWVEAATAEDSMSYLPWPTSLKGALTDAKFLNGFLMNSTDIGMAALFATGGSYINTNEQWGPGFCYFRIFDDGKIYATVPVEMLKIFNEAIGDGNEDENVVKTTLSAPKNSLGVREHSFFGGWNNFPEVNSKNPVGEYNTPEGLLSVSAHTTSEGGLNLILVNTNETVAHNIVPDFNNDYKLMEELILTSENLSDNNIPGSPDIVYTKRNIINSNQIFSSHYIPPKSIVVLKLVPLSYEYPPEKNALFYFSEQSGYEDGIVAVGSSNFGITAEMYDNRKMSSLNKAVIIIPKQGTDISDIVNDFYGNITNICYVGQADVKRNLAYFNVNLGDEPEGYYKTIIGNFEDGMFEVVDFYYRGSEKSEKQINKIDFKNADDSKNVPFISNNEYLVKTSVLFGEAFKAGDLCKITVVRGSTNISSDKNTVSIGYVNAIPNETCDFDFLMPTDAPSGNYTIIVEYMDNYSKTRKKTQEFYFNKPNEILMLTDVPKDMNGNEITLDNISDVSQIKFSIKNNEINKKEITFSLIVAFYSNDNKLLCTSASNVGSIETNGTTTFSVPISHSADLSNVDYCKVFFWSGLNNIIPYSNVYHIK